MDHIPITFEHNGKKYTGNFSSVHGAGQNVWYLMDNKNFYRGRLRIAKGKWVFNATTKIQELSDLADFFGDYLVAWFDSNYLQTCSSM